MIFSRVVKPLQWLWNGTRASESPAGEQSSTSTPAGDNAWRALLRTQCETLLDVTLVLETYLPLLPGAAQAPDERAAHALDFCQKILDNAAKTADEVRGEPRAQTMVAIADELSQAFASYREKLAANARSTDAVSLIDVNADRQKLVRATSDLRDAIQRRIRQLNESGRS